MATLRTLGAKSSYSFVPELNWQTFFHILGFARRTEPVPQMLSTISLSAKTSSMLQLSNCWVVNEFLICTTESYSNIQFESRWLCPPPAKGKGGGEQIRSNNARRRSGDSAARVAKWSSHPYQGQTANFIHYIALLSLIDTLQHIRTLVFCGLASNIWRTKKTKW